MATETTTIRKQYQDRLTELNNLSDQIVNWNRLMYTRGRPTIEVPGYGWVTLTPKVMNSFQSKLKKQYRDLFSEIFKLVPKGGAGRRAAGGSRRAAPQVTGYLTPSARAFLREACAQGRFGQAFGTGESLCEHLQFLIDQGIGSRALLVSLVHLYSRINGLKTGAGGGQFRVDELLQRYFSDCLEDYGRRLREREEVELPEAQQKYEAAIEAAGGDKRAERRAESAYNRALNTYSYTPGHLLASQVFGFVSCMIVPSANLSPEEKEALKNPEVVQNVQRMQRVVTETSGAYQTQEAARRPRSRGRRSPRT